MQVGISNCMMTCMFAVALTVGGQIRRSDTQSEIVPIGGNVNLSCPFVYDVTWQYVYWKKNDEAFYTHDVQSNTPLGNGARYEVSNHATRLTIKDLNETDSGIYHCKVVTYGTSNFTKEGGQVRLSVTDQEGGLLTTSPGVSFRASTKIAPKPTEDKIIIWPIIVPILIIIIIFTTLCLGFKYRQRIMDTRLFTASRSLRGSPANSSVQADISSEGPRPITSSRLNAPFNANCSSTPLLHTKPQQGSPAVMSDQANISPRALESTTFKRFYASAPCDLNSPSTPLLYNSAQLQQGSPANISVQADISSKASDTTTTSRLDPSDPCAPIFHSTPLPCSSAQVSKRTSMPLAPEFSNREIRDEEGTRTELLSSDTHGSDDVDVDDRPEENSNASKELTSDAKETPLPPVGPLLIEDLVCAKINNKRRRVVKRMRKVLHSFVELHEEEDAPQKGCKYSASIEKYLSSGNLCVQEDVLRDVEYFLDALDTIPVDRSRDVCEILLTMPVTQQSDRSIFDFYKDNFLKCDQDNQVRAANEKIASTLKAEMQLILDESKTRDAALNYISAIILDALVTISGSASLSQSLSQHDNSRSKQSAIETEQEASPPQQSVKASKRENDNLIQFWLSKVTRLRLRFQRRDILEKLEAFDRDADSPFKENTTDPPIMQIPNAEEFDKINMDENTNGENALDHQKMPYDDAKKGKISNLIDSTDLEPQPLTSSQPPSTNSQRLSRKQLLAKIAGSGETLASQLKDLIEKQEKEEKDTCKHEEKAIGCIDMQNYDAKEVKNANLKESTELNKESIEIHGEKEKDRIVIIT